MSIREDRARAKAAEVLYAAAMTLRIYGQPVTLSTRLEGLADDIHAGRLLPKKGNP